jgi:UPF0716 family protein affecting phage T7 exclusion
MIKGIFNAVLWILILFCLGYSIYRSTAVRETLVQGGREVVYGEPQHGMILGLCVIAAACILGSVLLVLDRRDIRIEEREDLSKRTLR